MKALVLFFYLSFASFCQAQSSKKKFDQSSEIDKIFKDEMIKFATTKIKKKDTLSYSHFAVIDKRSDTMSLGYVKYARHGGEFTKLITSLPISSITEHILLSSFSLDKDSNDTLLLVINKLRLYKSYGFNYEKTDNSESNPDYFLKLKLDFFQKRGNTYIPIFRKDTTYKFYYSRGKIEKGYLISKAVAESIKSFKLKLSFSNLKKLTTEEFNDYYSRQYKLPILRDTLLKKGIYETFSEFKNNNPRNKEILFTEGKLADQLFEIAGKDTILNRNHWGFCDGKNIYIKMGLNYFKLYKTKDDFLFIGSDILEGYYIGSGGSAPLSLPSNGGTIYAQGIPGMAGIMDYFRIKRFPLHLDITNGEIY